MNEYEWEELDPVENDKHMNAWFGGVIFGFMVTTLFWLIAAITWHSWTH